MGLEGMSSPPCSYARYAPKSSQYSIQLSNEDNDENAHEQIGELIIRESFACQNCLHVNVQTCFHA